MSATPLTDEQKAWVRLDAQLRAYAELYGESEAKKRWLGLGPLYEPTTTATASTYFSDNAERFLLEAILGAPANLPLVARLQLTDFRSAQRAEVLRACRELYAEWEAAACPTDLPYDAVRLCERLLASTVPPPYGGWHTGVAALLNADADWSAAREYARIITEAATRRRIEAWRKA